MAARLRIDHVECTVHPGMTEARVRLSLHDVAHARVGRAAGPDAWQRAVAEATVRAVAAFVGGRLDVSLDSVMQVSAGRFPLIVVTMNMLDPGGQLVFLSGTAPITDDRFLSVVKAVLHGMNRWIEPLLVADPLVESPRIDAADPRIH